MAACYGFRLALVLISVVLKPTFFNSAVYGNTQDIMKCQHMPLELGLILDSSNSLGESNFNRSRELFVRLVKSFDIGPDKTRVALVMFGRTIYTDTSFNLESYTSTRDVIEAILVNEHHRDEFSQTGEGLDYLRIHMLNTCVTRPNVTKIVVVITDEVSQHPEITRSASAQAAAEGIHVIVVGVGKNVDEAELLTLAQGNADMVITTNYFYRLKWKVDSLLTKICEMVVTEEMSTAPTAKTFTGCGMARPTDVFFVLSQSALGSEDTRWATDFITRFVQTGDLRPGFRYGLISDVCKATADPISAGRNYSDTSDQNRIPSLNFPSLDAQCQAESNRNKVAIIFSFREGKDLFKVQKYASFFVKQDVRVLVIDRSGQGVRICGAQTLTGQPGGNLLEELLDQLC